MKVAEEISIKRCFVVTCLSVAVEIHSLQQLKYSFPGSQLEHPGMKSFTQLVTKISPLAKEHKWCHSFFLMNEINAYVSQFQDSCNVVNEIHAKFIQVEYLKSEKQICFSLLVQHTIFWFVLVKLYS